MTHIYDNDENCEYKQMMKQIEKVIIIIMNIVIMMNMMNIKTNEKCEIYVKVYKL